MSTTVGVLTAGAAAGGLDARDIYQNCYNKDTGEFVNEWTCWVTVGAAAVGAGLTMHRGVDWWNGGRLLVEEYNGNLYERIDLVAVRSSFGVSGPATVRSNVLGGEDGMGQFMCWLKNPNSLSCWNRTPLELT